MVYRSDDHHHLLHSNSAVRRDGKSADIRSYKCWKADAAVVAGDECVDDVLRRFRSLIVATSRREILCCLFIQQFFCVINLVEIRVDFTSKYNNIIAFSSTFPLELGNLRWRSGVSFVDIFVHFWK